MELFIGAKPHGHDASIYAYIPDINKKYAISSERITRVKHDPSTFFFALDQFLNDTEKKILSKIKKIYLGISFSSYEYYHPVNNLKDGRFNYSNVLLTLLNIKSFNKKKNEEIYKKYFLNKFKQKIEIKIFYFDHEYCHNLSSIISSKFESCLSLSMDGMGDDKNFGSVYLKKNKRIELIKKYYSPNKFFLLKNKRFPCSLPGLYEFFTYLVGLKPNSEEGKVEALAAYGKKIKLIHELNKLVFFNDESNEIVINHKKLEKLFSYKNCIKLLKIYKKNDLCFLIQSFSEKIIEKIIHFYNKKYKFKNICLSGGLFANVIINLKIFKIFKKKIYIVPAMADDGSSEGACYALLRAFGKKLPSYVMPYLGSKVTKKKALKSLESNHYKYNYSFKYLGTKWSIDAAKEICKDKIIAVFHGNMEWGPRALGNRSILANPRNKKNHLKLNQNIKGRPLYQPFCPMILEEDMKKMFKDYYNNLHMTCAFEMNKEYAKKYPVAVHIDNTSRVQVVNKKSNFPIYLLLKTYKKKFGEGIVINTSFNKHGRTITNTVEDAIYDFFDSNLDYLYIEGYKVTKN